MRVRMLFLAAFVVFCAGYAEASVVRAEALYEQGDRKGAGEIIRDWVAFHPERARTARVAAILARTEPDPADAMVRWDEVIALEPVGELAAEARWAKGTHAYSAGLYVAAAQEFTLLATSYAPFVDPGRALLWRGYAELGADQPDEATESFREAEKQALDPVDVRGAQIGLAHASFRGGNIRDALRRYERFESEHGDDGRASAAARRIVECLRLLGREGEARSKAARIERDYPDSFEATLARAEIRRMETKAAQPDTPREREAVREVVEEPWIVQVASLSNPRNAAVLRRQILAMGIQDIRVERGEGPEGPVHRVVLGPFLSEAGARAIADSVAALGDLNPRVRQVRPDER